ncbi:hypothetical protein [Mesorhizobium sp.]|uniref:hypothetical protein n=1 Tax=Mesorhizobium sp. TaxID=1871066 RepID=UPI000FE94004|nr:hypothetical protein [Mesorhizobium sp.]RWE44199.1 MAG: hypothetical protein EOS80_19865 [Mesorhizobium sp.]
MTDEQKGYLSELRCKFAMAALQGCLAYSHYNEQWGDYHNQGAFSDLAKHCFDQADAMLVEHMERQLPMFPGAQ